MQRLCNRDEQSRICRKRSARLALLPKTRKTRSARVTIPILFISTSYSLVLSTISVQIFFGGLVRSDLIAVGQSSL